MSVRDAVARRQVLWFFALSYVFGWAVWPLTLVNPESTPMVPFGPLVAVLVVTAVVGGRRGLVALLKQMGRWRVHPLWYVIAVLGPFSLVALAAAAVVAGGASKPDWAAYADWSGLLTNLLVTVVIVGIFEELGWRGFAQPQLQQDHSALWAALVLGVVWGVWHLPELVSNPGQREPVAYLLAVVSWSVLMAWLYNSTLRGLPLVMLFHAAMNTSLTLLMPTLDAKHYSSVWWAVAGVSVVAAAVVAAWAGAGRLTTHRIGRRAADGAHGGDRRPREDGTPLAGRVPR